MLLVYYLMSYLMSSKRTLSAYFKQEDIMKDSKSQSETIQYSCDVDISSPTTAVTIIGRYTVHVLCSPLRQLSVTLTFNYQGKLTF